MQCPRSEVHRIHRKRLALQANNLFSNDPAFCRRKKSKENNPHGKFYSLKILPLTKEKERLSAINKMTTFVFKLTNFFFLSFIIMKLFFLPYRFFYSFLLISLICFHLLWSTSPMDGIQLFYKTVMIVEN